MFFRASLQVSLRKFGRSQEIWGREAPPPPEQEIWGAKPPPVYPSTLSTVKKYLILLQYTDVALENHMDVFLKEYWCNLCVFEGELKRIIKVMVFTSPP